MNDELGIPDFLKVCNRVPLAPERRAALKAVQKLAEHDLHAAERAREKERQRMTTERAAAQRAKDNARFKLLRERGKQ